VPWNTWHERQVERPSRRELVKDLGSVLLNGFLFIVMLGVTAAIVLVVLGFFLGLYNDWLIGILSTPPLPALFGIAIILFGGWGVWRVVARRSLPGPTRRARVGSIFVFISIGLIGAVVLVNALAADEGVPGF